MRRISAPLEASGVASAPAVAFEAGTRINSRDVPGSQTAPEPNRLKPKFSELEATRKSQARFAAVTGNPAHSRLKLGEPNSATSTPARLAVGLPLPASECTMPELTPNASSPRLTGV